MKAIILLNGEPHRGEIDASFARVYCCDGAYRWANGKVRIDETLGDFDSLDVLPDPPPSVIYPSEKNLTDGEIAIKRAVEAGATEIEIYGGGGGREDHFLGNLHLLYLAHQMGANAVMITNGARIRIACGKTVVQAKKGATLSIIPFGRDAHIIESSGLYYPLQDLWLRYGSTRGISNVMEGNEASFVSEGVVLVIINEEVV